jgi:putative Mn2+ efflux pump MntP
MLAKLLALVLPLGLDTFAVAAAIGAAGLAPTRRLRVALLFTVFEGGMPLVGLAAGAPLAHAVGSAADYLAIVVLLMFGIYTLFRSDDDDQQAIGRLLQAGGFGALALGISISLDELAIGFTIGLLRFSAALVIVLIAVQTFVVTQVGLRLGSRLSERLRERAERLAGIALTGLAVALLVEKLFG